MPVTVLGGQGRLTSRDHQDSIIQAEADNYSPVGSVITKHVGDPALNNADAKKAISNSSSMPASAVYSWTNAPALTSAGLKDGVVKVGFSDDSSINVRVLVNVLSYADDPAYAPIGGTITVAQNHVVDSTDAKNAVANHTALASVTNGYSWNGTVDTSVAGSHVAGLVTVHYIDGSTRDVGVTVIVSGASTPATTPSEASRYNPMARTIEANFGEDLSGKANEGIANTSAMPTGTRYDFAYGTPATSRSGYEPTVIKVTFSDGTTKLVNTQVHVTSDADRYNPTPRPIESDPRDPDRPVDPSDPTNPTPGVDHNTVPNGTTTSWPTEPGGHPTEPGDYPTTIVVHYPDGSSETVPTINHVPSRPTSPRTDADRNDPIGTTIEKDMGQRLTNDDAKRAIANNGSLTHVTGYSWDYAPDTSTHGLKGGRVKVSYQDNTYDIVHVMVNVLSMADRYNPSPRPVTVDPSDPTRPTDPSDSSKPNTRC